MGIYSPGRRRLIIGLLLTSVLLLAIDVQQNNLFDHAREGFHAVLDPLESAAEVASRPVRNAWRGITDYDDVADENERLRQLLEAQTADQISARAAVQEYRDLLALNNLESLADYESVTAEVIGQSPTNIEQIIEINKGEDDGIEVGMAVVSVGGLVGKITKTAPDRSWVMLATDHQFAVNAKVLGGGPPPGDEETTATTLPANAVPNDAISSTTSSTISTAPPSTESTAVPTTSAPETSTGTTSPDDTTPDDGTTPGTTATTATTATPSTTSPPIEKETGLVEGQGRDQPVQIRLIDESIDVGLFRRGDVVMTAGGDGSLAPPGIPIGRVSKVVRRAGSAGPILEVGTNADLNRLNFVEIVLYRPLSEADPDELEAGTDSD